MFIGHVVGIKPNPTPGWEDIVVFSVETALRGINSLTFETEQGYGSDCGVGFSLGERVIYGGSLIWEPTVILAAPPTPEQVRQIEFVQTMIGDN